MAGATLEFDATAALAVINEVAQAMGRPEPLLDDIGHYLREQTEDRFKRQQAPDGTPWQALTPRYQRRKRKNGDKILVLDGWLSSKFTHQVHGDELLVGTNRVYAAIHQFGGVIDVAARSQQAYFRQGKNGEVGNSFVSKRKSNFAQWVTIGAYQIRIPARPFLGVSESDGYAIAGIAMRYLFPTR